MRRPFRRQRNCGNRGPTNRQTPRKPQGVARRRAPLGGPSSNSISCEFAEVLEPDLRNGKLEYPVHVMTCVGWGNEIAGPYPLSDKGLTRCGGHIFRALGESSRHRHTRLRMRPPVRFFREVILMIRQSIPEQDLTPIRTLSRCGINLASLSSLAHPRREIPRWSP